MIFFSFWRAPENFTIGLCLYIAPASDHSLLTISLPSRVILRRFEVVFVMSGVRMLHFLKDWYKFIQIHQYYTMALTPRKFVCFKQALLLRNHFAW